MAALPPGSPEYPTLLIPPEVRNEVLYPGWEATLGSQQSFYIAGANSALAQYGLGDVKSIYREWPEASEILKSSNWYSMNLQWGAKIAYQQFLRAQSGNAVLFTKAASIILTFAVAAARKGRNGTVFEWMQIIPACFYVEGFDEKKLARLKHVPSFAKEALEAMTQYEEALLTDMARGFGVTRTTADKLRKFISEHYPDEPIGNVSARQVKRTNGFSTRSASAHEKVDL